LIFALFQEGSTSTTILGVGTGADTDFTIITYINSQTGDVDATAGLDWQKYGDYFATGIACSYLECVMLGPYDPTTTSKGTLISYFNISNGNYITSQSKG